ncbi:carnosine synthase 1 [Aspergillus udagawae]|uniref:Carnosine synthase 1 n=1 Tax=Aspergillus udagawae TaxID=91492 RepID=A0ABQ1B732_9EURO|nr:carnosine synthase 1 [Aspergillus udagawae]GFG16537.1 carnosine synthase 1 [Aspergillus udagawae]
MQLSKIKGSFTLYISGPSDLQEKFTPIRWKQATSPPVSAGGETMRGQRKPLCHEGTVLVASDVLIKPYIDGSEVAVNFVLWNGEILFCEVSDDFPSNADSPGATSSDTFQETAFVHPSRLAPSEQNLLRKALLDRILHMYSAMKYVEENGILDLQYNVTRDEQQRPKPSVFLIKINPRPPGHYGLTSLTWTYGLDYFALHVLHALGDEARMRALSEPFMCGPQYDGVIMLVIPERGGILTSGDPAWKFREEDPGIMDNILLRREPFAKGDFVPSPDAPTMPFLSVLVPCSKNGRGGLLRSIAII